MIWHWRLAHASFAWVQSLFQPRVFVTSQQGGDTKEDSVISPKHPTTYKCSAPKCTSCCVSKSKQHNIHKTASSPLSKYLSINTTLPGEKLFVDQYVSIVKGRLSTSRGKEYDKDKRLGGTIFVNAATSFTFIVHQTSLNAADTIRSKLAFERERRAHGIHVQG